MKTGILILLVTFQATRMQAQSGIIQTLFNDYLHLEKAIADHSVAEAADAALSMYIMIADNEDTTIVRSLGTNRNELLNPLSTIIADTTPIQQQSAFSKLSFIIWDMVKTANDFSGTIYFAYCPANNYYWISREIPAQNPYFGDIIASCSNITESIEK